MMNDSFYQVNDKFNLEKCFGNYSGVLTEDDQRLVRAWLAEKRKSDHITPIRERKLGYSLASFKRFLPKPFSDVRLDDVLDGIEAMKSGNVARNNKHLKRDRPLSERTKYDLVSILKPFLIWMAEAHELKAWMDAEVQASREDEIKRVEKAKGKKITDKEKAKILGISEREAVSIIKEAITAKVCPPDPGRPEDRIKGEDLLTPDDIIALIAAANNDRDRALISTLYESGCRVGELGRMEWGDVSFDEHGVGLTIWDTKTSKNSKTPKKRYSRLVNSAGYLAILKDSKKINPDLEFVFVTDDGKPITYGAVVRMLERTAKRAGITKKVNPHAFRHARATTMINENYQESVIKKSLWNNLNTKMFSTYVNLADKDIDKEFLSKHGIAMEDKRPKPMGPKPCDACGHSNGPGAKHCAECGNPLTPEGRKQKKSDEEVISGPVYDEMTRLKQEKQQQEIDDLKRQLAEFKAMMEKSRA